MIIVSHDMDAVAENCDKVALFSEGKIQRIGTPREIFYDEALLADAEMGVPSVVKVVKEMEKRGVDLGERPITKDEFVRAIRRWRHE